MRHPHAFLVATFAAMAAGCGLMAATMAPIDGNRAGTAAGFSFSAGMAAASGALALAAAADGAAHHLRRRRRA